MKMKNLIYFLIVGIAMLTNGCYDDYLIDFEYSATYFPIQQPIRTVVAETTEGSFEVGVVLAGRRENTKNETVTFAIDNSLLNDPTKAVMPASYYSLELPGNDYIMTIPSGSLQGAVKVVLNSSFFNDPLSVTNHYVIPFKIISSTLDSILAEKDYTLPVVKYINKYHGWYYQKGQERQLDASGAVASTFTYSNKDLIDHKALELETVNMGSLLVPALGKTSQSMKITVNNDNTVSYESLPGNDPVTGLASSYSPTDRRFFLNYKYVDNGTTYNVFDTLYYRNTELRYESWQ